ncbi:MAG: CHAT domain-containing protein [Acidobacteriota bacterium]
MAKLGTWLLAPPAVWCALLTAPSPAVDPFPVTFRGAIEADVAESHLTPVMLDKRPAGLCFRVDPTVDSHAWLGSLRVGRQVLAADIEPSARRAGTVCFETKVDAGKLAQGVHQLCAVIRDPVDGSVLRPPCHLFRYRSGWKAPVELWKEVRAAMAEAEDPVAELDRLAARAADLGMRFMPVQIQLMAVHVLVNRGTAAARAEALDRLDALPAWLDDPVASHWRGQERLQRSRLLEARGDRQGAWRALDAAARASELTASTHGLGITMYQVGMLAGQGDLSGAVSRLRAALAECELGTCHSSLVQSAKGQLAWRLPQRAEVTDDELVQAAGMLEAAAVDAEGDPLEVANHLINLAWVLLRRGDLDSLRRLDGALNEARGSLDRAPPSERTEVIRGWGDVVEGLASLERAPDIGLEICSRWSGSGDSELAAWASACTARLARRAGDGAAAAHYFDLALLHHEYLRLGEERARAPMGPGERASVFYRAARVAAESGEVGRAWDVLSRLDALAPGLEARRQCRGAASGDDLVEWRTLDDEASELFSRLDSLTGPAAGDAQQIRGLQRYAAKQRLREIFLRRPGCPPTSEVRSRADLKVFALDGEMWAIRRLGSTFQATSRSLGGVDIGDAVSALIQARAQRLASADEWRRLATPVASVLLPLLEFAGPGPLELSLHGVLQDVPISALPTPDGSYFGLTRTLSQVPAATAGTGGPESPTPLAEATGVIVLDPLGDLAGARELLPFYRGLGATPVLLGAEATVTAFEKAASGVDWLHVDGHGHYDPAFPELSGLLLADGAMDLERLSRLESVPAFVNLSGCRTGAWPRTADSGRYGLGGLLVRRGARWVIATSDDLDNRLAADFNRAFYRPFFAGRSVPEAFGEALAAVAESHPPASWSHLLLLTAPDVLTPDGGNSSPSPLPVK